MPFHLVDLVSQRAAVREHLIGKSAAELLAWLATKGRVRRLPTPAGSVETWVFESTEGLSASFFFDSGGIVFFGNHTTFV